MTENSAQGTPPVSIILPCYNHGRYLMDAIQSVERCDPELYELIIIDDGSTEPMTCELMAHLSAKNYHVIRQANQGLSRARNRGIEAAKGRYILPLDADNKIHPDYLKKGAKILDLFPEVGVVYGDSQFFGEEIKRNRVGPFDLTRFLAHNCVDACAVFRKKVWEQVGGYDEQIPDKLGWEDWDFWLMAVEKGWEFYYIRQILFYYRIRSDSMNKKCWEMDNPKKLRKYIYGKHCHLLTRHFYRLIYARSLKGKIRFYGHSIKRQLKRIIRRLLNITRAKS